MARRVITSFILLISILFWPFWVSVLIALGAMLYFRIYWEATIAFLIVDLLYGTGAPTLYLPVLASFFTAVVLLLVIEISKKELRFYPVEK